MPATRIRVGDQFDLPHDVSRTFTVRSEKSRNNDWRSLPSWSEALLGGGSLAFGTADQHHRCASLADFGLCRVTILGQSSEEPGQTRLQETDWPERRSDLKL